VKKKAKNNNQSSNKNTNTGENNQSQDRFSQEGDDYDHSTIYIKNEKTGLWEVRNPSGSIGYNYLYRDDL